MIFFPECFGQFSPLMPLANESAEFHRMVFMSDTFVLQVGSSKERRYLSPEAKNTVCSTPVPNTLSVIVGFFFSLLVVFL